MTIKFEPRPESNRFKSPGQAKTPKMQTTTLWDFPSQHYGEDMQGDSEYIGATPSYVIWNLLHRFTTPGAVVVDPFCGSGTTLDVCKDLDRRGLGFDIAPSRPDIQRADARRLPLEDASVDFMFMDPPYSTHVKYSGDEQCIGELDARGGGYYEAMEEVIADAYRLLKPGAYFALYVSDSQAKGKAFCPIGFELFLRMSRLFEPVDIVSVTRHNKSLKRNHWHTSAIEGNYFLRGFNYLFVVRKRPLEASETHKHEEAGMLSKLFEAAAKASPGQVVTPDKFAHLLDQEKDLLTSNLSRKQQKKIHRSTHLPESRAHQPVERSAAREDEKPHRDFADRKPRAESSDKPRRDFSDRKPRAESSDKPRRDFSDRKPRAESSDKPRRDFSDRRPRAESPDKPRRDFADRKPRAESPDKPRRDFADRKPRTESSDKPRRDYSDRKPRAESSDKPRRDFADRKPRTESSEKPRRDYSDRKPRTESPDKPRRDFSDRKNYPDRRLTRDESAERKPPRRESAEQAYERKTSSVIAPKKKGPHGSRKTDR